MEGLRVVICAGVIIDPVDAKRQVPNFMPFEFTKISDVGTANPIAARIGYQWFEIFNWYNLSKGQQEGALEILLMKVQPRLVECEHISKSLSTDFLTGRNEGLQFQSGGRAVGVPSVMRLKERAEGYLNQAKLALDEFSSIFSFLFGREIPSGNILRVLKWSERHLGKSDPLSKCLRTDHDEWIKKLCDMRNGIWHGKTSPSGALEIFPFRVNYATPIPSLIDPAWRLGTEVNPTFIEADMAAFNHNLLTFCEDSILGALGHLPMKAPISIIEIPEAERNPAIAIRFRAGLADGAAGH